MQHVSTNCSPDQNVHSILAYAAVICAVSPSIAVNGLSAQSAAPCLHTLAAAVAAAAADLASPADKAALDGCSEPPCPGCSAR